MKTFFKGGNKKQKSNMSANLGPMVMKSSFLLLIKPTFSPTFADMSAKSVIIAAFPYRIMVVSDPTGPRPLGRPGNNLQTLGTSEPWGEGR